MTFVTALIANAAFFILPAYFALNLSFLSEIFLKSQETRYRRVINNTTGLFCSFLIAVNIVKNGDNFFEGSLPPKAFYGSGFLAGTSFLYFYIARLEYSYKDVCNTVLTDTTQVGLELLCSCAQKMHMKSALLALKKYYVLNKRIPLCDQIEFYKKNYPVIHFGCRKESCMPLLSCDMQKQLFCTMIQPEEERTAFLKKLCINDAIFKSSLFWGSSHNGAMRIFYKAVPTDVLKHIIEYVHN